METRTEVNIPCGTLNLEGILEYPSKGAGPFPAAVICHPHPLFGGNMYNNVVRAVRKALLDRECVCLRFNFRGTGRSWGTHGEGITEVDDVIAAIDFILAQENVDPGKLLVAGYSFGCWVGLKAAAKDPRANLLVGISPPCNEYDYSFLNNETRPKFLIVGGNDFVCSVEKFKDMTAGVPEPKMSVILPGTDHFHVGGEHNLVDHLNKFLDKYPL